MSILLYLYLAGVLTVGAGGAYGCANDTFAANHAHGGVEGAACYAVVGATAVLWPIPAGFAGYYLVTE